MASVLLRNVSSLGYLWSNRLASGIGMTENLIREEKGREGKNRGTRASWRGKKGDEEKKAMGLNSKFLR